MAQHLKVYMVYCGGHAESTEILQGIMKNPAGNAQVVEIIKKGKESAESRGLDIFSFLLKPVQRICKYPLLIREILKHTPPEHLDYGNLVQASNSITKVVDNVNERRRFIENQKLLGNAMSRLEFPDNLPLHSIPTRTFIHEGTLQKSTPPIKSTRIFVLFSDCLIIAKPTGFGFGFSSTPAVNQTDAKSKAVVREILKIGDFFILDFEKHLPSFILSYSSKQSTYFCHTLSEKQHWVTLLTQQEPPSDSSLSSSVPSMSNSYSASSTTSRATSRHSLYSTASIDRKQARYSMGSERFAYYPGHFGVNFNENSSMASTNPTLSSSGTLTSNNGSHLSTGSNNSNNSSASSNSNNSTLLNSVIITNGVIPVGPNIVPIPVQRRKDLMIERSLSRVKSLNDLNAPVKASTAKPPFKSGSVSLVESEIVKLGTSLDSAVGDKQKPKPKAFKKMSEEELDFMLPRDRRMSGQRFSVIEKKKSKVLEIENVTSPVDLGPDAALWKESVQNEAFNDPSRVSFSPPSARITPDLDASAPFRALSPKQSAGTLHTLNKKVSSASLKALSPKQSAAMLHPLNTKSSTASLKVLSPKQSSATLNTLNTKTSSSSLKASTRKDSPLLSELRRIIPYEEEPEEQLPKITSPTVSFRIIDDEAIPEPPDEIPFGQIVLEVVKDPVEQEGTPIAYESETITQSAVAPLAPTEEVTTPHTEPNLKAMTIKNKDPSDLHITAPELQTETSLTKSIEASNSQIAPQTEEILPKQSDEVVELNLDSSIVSTDLVQSASTSSISATSPAPRMRKNSQISASKTTESTFFLTVPSESAIDEDESENLEELVVIDDDSSETEPIVLTVTEKQKKPRLRRNKNKDEIRQQRIRDENTYSRVPNLGDVAGKLLSGRPPSSVVLPDHYSDKSISPPSLSPTLSSSSNRKAFLQSSATFNTSVSPSAANVGESESKVTETSVKTDALLSVSAKSTTVRSAHVVEIEKPISSQVKAELDHTAPISEALEMNSNSAESKQASVKTDVDIVRLDQTPAEIPNDAHVEPIKGESKEAVHPDVPTVEESNSVSERLEKVDEPVVTVEVEPVKSDDTSKNEIVISQKVESAAMKADESILEVKPIVDPEPVVSKTEEIQSHEKTEIMVTRKDESVLPESEVSVIPVEHVPVVLEKNDQKLIADTETKKSTAENAPRALSEPSTLIVSPSLEIVNTASDVKETAASTGTNLFVLLKGFDSKILIFLGSLNDKDGVVANNSSLNVPEPKFDNIQTEPISESRITEIDKKSSSTSDKDSEVTVDDNKRTLPGVIEIPTKNAAQVSSLSPTFATSKELKIRREKSISNLNSGRKVIQKEPVVSRRKSIKFAIAIQQQQQSLQTSGNENPATTSSIISSALTNTIASDTVVSNSNTTYAVPPTANTSTTDNTAPPSATTSKPIPIPKSPTKSRLLSQHQQQPSSSILTPPNIERQYSANRPKQVGAVKSLTAAFEAIAKEKADPLKIPGKLGSRIPGSAHSSSTAGLASATGGSVGKYGSTSKSYGTVSSTRPTGTTTVGASTAKTSTTATTTTVGTTSSSSASTTVKTTTVGRTSLNSGVASFTRVGRTSPSSALSSGIGFGKSTTSTTSATTTGSEFGIKTGSGEVVKSNLVLERAAKFGGVDKKRPSVEKLGTEDRANLRTPTPTNEKSVVEKKASLSNLEKQRNGSSLPDKERSLERSGAMSKKHGDASKKLEKSAKDTGVKAGKSVEGTKKEADQIKPPSTESPEAEKQTQVETSAAASESLEKNLEPQVSSSPPSVPEITISSNTPKQSSEDIPQGATGNTESTTEKSTEGLTRSKSKTVPKPEPIITDGLKATTIKVKALNSGGIPPKSPPTTSTTIRSPKLTAQQRTGRESPKSPKLKSATTPTPKSANVKQMTTTAKSTLNTVSSKLQREENTLAAIRGVSPSPSNRVAVSRGISPSPSANSRSGGVSPSVQPNRKLSSNSSQLEVNFGTTTTGRKSSNGSNVSVSSSTSSAKSKATTVPSRSEEKVKDRTKAWK
ncbi:guanine nucleotide exchange factor 9 [Nowakowskiella sp. JEL0407]|nr:guanine nucleotide exchange factor 9 [Nowakowskiella sp. JEL0407]